MANTVKVEAETSVTRDVPSTDEQEKALVLAFQELVREIWPDGPPSKVGVTVWRDGDIRERPTFITRDATFTQAVTDSLSD